jgi:hypothetical protein
MYVCAPVWCLNGWILLIFGFRILSIIRRGPVNMNILVSKLGALQVGPKTQNGDFFLSKTAVVILIKFQ